MDQPPGVSEAVGGILGLLEGQQGDVERMEASTRLIESRLGDAAIILARVLGEMGMLRRHDEDDEDYSTVASSSVGSSSRSPTPPRRLTRSPSMPCLGRVVVPVPLQQHHVMVIANEPTSTSSATHDTTSEEPYYETTFGEEFYEEPPVADSTVPSDSIGDDEYAAAEEWVDPDAPDSPPPPPLQVETHEIGINTEPARTSQQHEATIPSLGMSPPFDSTEPSPRSPGYLFTDFRFGDTTNTNSHYHKDATSSPEAPICRMVSTSGASGSSIMCPPLALGPPQQPPSEMGTDRESVSVYPTVSGVGKRRNSTSPSMFAHGGSLHSRKQATISSTVEIYKTSSPTATPTYDDVKFRGSLKRSDAGKADPRRYSTINPADVMLALKRKASKAQTERHTAKLTKLERKETTHREAIEGQELKVRKTKLNTTHAVTLLMIEEEYDRMVLLKEREAPTIWKAVKHEMGLSTQRVGESEREATERTRVARKEASERKSLKKNFQIILKSVAATQYQVSSLGDTTVESAAEEPPSPSLAVYYATGPIDGDKLVTKALREKVWKKKMDTRKDPPKPFYVNQETRERVWDLKKHLCETTQTSFRKDDPRHAHIYTATCKACKIHWEGIPNRWRCDACSAELWQPSSHSTVASRYCAACESDISKTPPLHNVNCRVCGRVCCQACAKQTMPMPRLGYSGRTLVPVCNVCLGA